MFKGKRFLTKNISERIPLVLQIILYNLIDDMSADKKDYLQIFKLSEVNGLQQIIHSQEEPPYHQKYLVDMGGLNISSSTIFVIDDGEHSTMLFAEEY